MSDPKKRRLDSTVVSGTGARPASGDGLSATQILQAADAGRVRKRAGESSVILQGDRIRKHGPGIAVKFASSVSLIIGVSMLVFGLVIYNNMKGALEDEIDAAGVHAAKSLAATDYAAWLRFHGAYAGTHYGGFEEEIGRGEKKIPGGALTEAQRQAADLRMSKNEERLKDLISEDGRVLDALITSPDRTSIVRIASGNSYLDFSRKPEEGRREGVTIHYGTYKRPDGRLYAARSFIAPIVNEHGIEEGKATVVLSEASIQRRLNAVLGQVLILTLVFIAIGVGVSFFVGRRITSPIKDLTKDVEIIARGNLEHHARANTSDEVGVLARTVDLMARSLKAAQGAQAEHLQQKHQLSVALEIQSNLFPKTLPNVEGWEVQAYYRPGPEVGGDYYDIFTLPDGRLFMNVASASGKGVPAAMVTTMARSFTNAIAERETGLKEIFKTVNRLLSPDLRRGMYVTALGCILEPGTGKLIVANAGHHPLIRFNASTSNVAPIHSDGIALGFDQGPVFDRTLQDVEITLNPGDRIVMVTPGVFGIRNREGRELGEENFYRLIGREGAKDSKAFVKLVVHTLNQFIEGGLVESDITFLTLKRV